MSYSRSLSTLLLMAFLASCTYVSQGVLVDEDRKASISERDVFGDSAKRVVYAKQNWGGADSLWFYNVTQGSNLIPYELFLHLEVAGTEKLFRADANMNRLRYLPQKSSISNPEGLPVGWVKDNHEGENYIGFTCAACHTGQINYQGTAIRIDGAPALADMEKMLTELAAALDASLIDQNKFDRLALKVLRTKYPEEKAAFRTQLVNTAQKIHNYNHINAPKHGDTSVAYGYARLDAFGRIYNRILAHLTPNQPNANPANAPVSYPYLWDTPHHDFVQWNGVGDNELAGPLGRNAGEALGVFASFDLLKQKRDVGYRSSVVVRNLTRMEEHLESLWSPLWEDLEAEQILPPIDKALAERGRYVFMEYQCHTCHKPIDRTDPKRRIVSQYAKLDTIGTDPLMAMNAIKHSGKSGYFEGERIKPLKKNSPRFGPTTPVLPALSVATAGVLLEPDHDKTFIRRWAEKLYDLSGSIFDNPIKKTERYVDFVRVNKNKPDSLAAYKARPLNGIWATAPYLHNGSVPSLYELFMPSCSDAEIAGGKVCRPNRFTVGAREFDPVKVGFVQREPRQYPEIFIFDTQLPSNSNKGHEYAAGVTPVFILDAQGKPVKDADGKPRMRKLPPINDEQRFALVEYLKTL